MPGTLHIWVNSNTFLSLFRHVLLIAWSTLASRKGSPGPCSSLGLMLHPSSPSNEGVPSFRKMVLKGSLDRVFLLFILSYLRPKFAFHGLPNSWKINVGSIALSPFFSYCLFLSYPSFQTKRVQDFVFIPPWHAP